MTQRDLFPDVRTPPAQRHSATSLAAAEAIEPRAASLRRAVLDLLRTYADGMTDQEMQQALGLTVSTQVPRRVELMQAGLVGDSGRTRLTLSGRKAVVWVVR